MVETVAFGVDKINNGNERGNQSERVTTDNTEATNRLKRTDG